MTKQYRKFIMNGNVHKLNDMEAADAAMEKEFLILSQLEKNELAPPQRTIASHTGLSVGTVNLLLKRMARKVVKFEKMNKRNLRYILTPKGDSGEDPSGVQLCPAFLPVDQPGYHRRSEADRGRKGKGAV